MGDLIELRIKIPIFLEKPFVWLLLLYRRLRFGYPFRRIPLTQNKFAIVDPDDYDRLSKYKWYAAKGGNSFYAVRGKWSKTRKKRITIAMHHLILPPPPGLVINHINHNAIDNRKANLRLATQAQNCRNARFNKKNAASKYRGVWYRKQTKKWRAAIVVNRKRKHLGQFSSEIQAAKAYDEAAKKYHKEFASLNFKSPRRREPRKYPLQFLVRGQGSSMFLLAIYCAGYLYIRILVIRICLGFRA